MKRKPSISKLLTGVFFLSIYGNVLFTQLLCNIPHLLESCASSHTRADGHDHHHGNEGIPFSEHTHDDSHSHEESSPSDDNCCNEISASFFAQQTVPANSTVDVKNLFSSDFILSESAFFCFNPFINSKGFAPTKYPPPKIPDIRIFIHSFLI